MNQIPTDPSPSSTPAPSTPSLSACPGATFEWHLKSPFSTYPFGIHADASRFHPGYTFVTASEVDSTVTVRSKSCHGVAGLHTCCKNCSELRPEIDVVIDRAKSQDPGKKQTLTLSYSQIQSQISNITESRDKAKLSVS